MILIKPTINITKEHHAFAKECTEKILKELHREGNTQVPHFQTDEYDNRYMGFLGEIIFKSFIEGKVKSYDYENSVHENNADDYDFKINEKRWDIKAARKRNYNPTISENFEILLHPKQVGKHAEYYFWILIEGPDVEKARKAYLMGGMNAKNISKYPKKEKIPGMPTYCIPIDELIPTKDCLMIMNE